MSEEVDTLESQKNGIPKYILENEIQVLPMIEEQIETRKMNLEEERVQREIASQKVYNNHKNLEQEKQKNEH